MSRRLIFLALSVLLAACATNQDATIAELRNRQIEIREMQVDGGLEKAMEGYRRFLEESPSSTLSSEAIRRLADLKIEKEYGIIDSGIEAAPLSGTASRLPAAATLQALSATLTDSEDDFERRATSRETQHATAPRENLPLPGGDDLERAGALEAVGLYRRLLNDYPQYERNDQALYQLSRAYEELGRIEEAIQVMNRLVRYYPASRYIDEVQFRRGEYFFMHRRYLDAEGAYKNVTDIGVSSPYYQLALYKLGWALYKQELYAASLQRFITLLDYKEATGYDFSQMSDEIEHKRMDDTFRVISLAFSYLGGADAVASYFNTSGKRSFEDDVYSNLAEYYYDKRRYNDAVSSYSAFVNSNPFHSKAPLFQMRVIEIHIAGGFPSLVIDAKKEFSATYDLKEDYWHRFKPASRPEVIAFLKTNLTDLANHYHALYRDKRHVKQQSANFSEALHWYREFLASFPQEIESPVIHYQLADLLLENKAFAEAAVEYEKTAYGYPLHVKAATAGYAAVYAYRQQLAIAGADERLEVKHKVVQLSLKFAEIFPEHEKTAVVLGAAADDLYDMEEFQQAQSVTMQLITTYPDASTVVLRDAWLVAAHSAFKLEQYEEAEGAYVKVLELLPEQDKVRADLFDNLAAAIYKQGELAQTGEDYRSAANHYLRVGVMAPTSQFRPTAEYDAAAALIQLQDWQQATTVLLAFRDNFPGHELQTETTKKIAFVYREDGQLALAAAEFEQVANESMDDELRRETLLIAAQLHVETGDNVQALGVYRRYVEAFPQPVELNLEARDKIAGILNSQNEREDYLAELRQIVDIEAAASEARTPRSRYLAGSAALILAEGDYANFVSVALVKPFEVNLAQKKQHMKVTTNAFTALLEYEIGEFTAAATFYLAETYTHLSKALMESERPDNLNPLELEQYELALEDQAFPFEEKAIAVHQNNLELIPLGIYNIWVDRSLQKLAELIPARYNRPEATSDIMTSLSSFMYALQPNEVTIDAIETTDATISDSVDKEPLTEPAVIEPTPTDAASLDNPAKDKEENP